MTRLAHIRSRFGGSPHIFIATPSYDGKVSGVYSISMAQTLPRLVSEGIAFDYFLMTGNCHVDDARNGCLREFLKTECTDLVFIDADVGWSDEDFVKLCRYDRDIVAGVYPKKTQDDSDTAYPVYLPSGTELRADGDGLIAVSGAPTGFMRIRRRVVEAMVAANSHRQHTGQNKDDSDPYTIVFERTYKDGHRWSGDYAFCQAWIAMGGSVYVDPEMRLAHEGSKEWIGTLGDHLREQAGLYHPRLIKSLAAIKNGDLRIERFVQAFDGWGNKFSASCDMQLALYLAARDVDGDILETGSGLSTILMGMAADATGGKMVHALEHDLDYFNKTWKALEAFGIENVTLHYAPLVQLSDGSFWYGPRSELPEKFGLVICDGPQRRFGRKGLFSLFGPRIADAIWMMDDCDDSGQLAIIKAAAAAAGRSVHLMGLQDNLKFAVSPRPSASV